MENEIVCIPESYDESRYIEFFLIGHSTFKDEYNPLWVDYVDLLVGKRPD